MKWCDLQSTKAVIQVADHKPPKSFFFQDIALHWTLRLTYTLLDHLRYLLLLGRVISKHWHSILLYNRSQLLTGEFKEKDKYYIGQA